MRCAVLRCAVLPFLDDCGWAYSRHPAPARFFCLVWWGLAGVAAAALRSAFPASCCVARLAAERLGPILPDSPAPLQFLPPLLVDAALRLDWFTFSKVRLALGVVRRLVWSSAGKLECYSVAC